MINKSFIFFNFLIRFIFIIIWDLISKKRERDEDNAIVTANHDNDQYLDSLLEPIDILMVDSKSRITFTHKLQKILSVRPNDKIIVYHNRQDKKLIFKVQGNDGVILDRWILIYNNGSKNDFAKHRKVSEIKDNNTVNKSNIQDKKDLYQTHILIVDNDKDTVETLKDLLENKGYTNIKTFFNSKEVLKDLNDIDKFKIAVLDIRMPDINGIQLYNILKIFNPQIKILFFTALDSVNEITSMMNDIKQEDIMRKPLDITQFIERVNSKISTS